MNRAVTFFVSLAVILQTVASAFAQDAKVRLDPSQVQALPVAAAGAGTSKMNGIEVRLLRGDPSQAGLYSIAITVPPNSRIEAHTHRDNRTAVVAAGVWHFGYGSAASQQATRALPPGSFYTEPAGEAHFAWTGPEGATVVITGTGPSDTHYVNSADDPVKP